MWKRMLQLSNGNHEKLSDDEQSPESNGHGPTLVATEPVPVRLTPVGATPSELGPPLLTDFEQIYHSGTSKPPRLSYGVLKVAEMLESSHLGGMTPETKRGALLMALEAGGAKIEDILQDAIVRQRLLTEYEEARQKDLQNFESSIQEQNRTLQAEMDRITGQYMSRMQGNLDEVARAQDNLRVWQKRKRHEAQRIADAAACCVPEAGTTAVGLTVVLERASTATAR